MTGEPPPDDRTQYMPREPGSATTPPAPSTPPASPLQAEDAPRRGRLQPGTVLNDTYRIVRFISQGGMGEVHEGVHLISGDRVAIKAILGHLADDELVEKMFHKEAAALRKIRDPAIVRYENIMRDRALGVLYLAMEYIDGESLADRLARQPITEGEARSLLDRLAKALDAAHHATNPQTNEISPIYHRDVSPDNVILRNGRMSDAVLIDFGIARDAKLSEGTVIGAGFAGKFGYVAPEQLGDFGGEIGPWTDVYSLALTIAAAVRGKPVPMGATIVDAIDKRRAGVRLPDVPPGLRPLLESMLVAEPFQRIRRMSEVREALSGVLATVAMPAEPEPQPVKPAKPPKIAKPPKPPKPAKLETNTATGAGNAPAGTKTTAADLWAKAMAPKNRGLVFGIAGAVLVVLLTSIVLLGPWSGPRRDDTQTDPAGTKSASVSGSTTGPTTGPTSTGPATGSQTGVTDPGAPVAGTTPPADGSAAVQLSGSELLVAVQSALDEVSCSWITATLVGTRAITLSGFTAEPAALVEQVSARLNDRSVRLNPKGIVKAPPMKASACEVVDTLRRNRAAPDSGLSLGLPYLTREISRQVLDGVPAKVATIDYRDFAYTPKDRPRQFLLVYPDGRSAVFNQPKASETFPPTFYEDAPGTLVIASVDAGLLKIEPMRIGPPVASGLVFESNTEELLKQLRSFQPGRLNALAVGLTVVQ